MSLPFITPPAPAEKRIIGNKKVGELEIEVFGGLTTAEMEMIEELASGSKSAHVAAAQLSKKISDAEVVETTNEKGEKSKKKLSLVESYLIVNNAMFNKDQAPGGDVIALKYSSDIEEIMRILTMTGQRRIVASVTALIRCRLDRPNWTIEDTRKQPWELIQAIYDLIKEEQASEEEESVNPPTEQELGKQQPEQRKEKEQIGQESSTTSPTPTPIASGVKPSTGS